MILVTAPELSDSCSGMGSVGNLLTDTTSLVQNYAILSNTKSICCDINLLNCYIAGLQDARRRAEEFLKAVSQMEQFQSVLQMGKICLKVHKQSSIFSLI